MTYISFHALQTFPFSNLNRDGEGAPKAMNFGGVNRTRISSQCLKRAIRQFAELQGQMSPTIRTREIQALVADRLASRAKLAGKELENAAKSVGEEAAKLSGSTGKNGVLAFWSHGDLEALCDLAENLETTSKKEVKAAVIEVLQNAESAVALFGRMFASEASLSIDGAAQVAHAFTVHRTNAELDYFTAAEDWTSKPESAGAGHLDTAEFSAGTFYRYANLGLNELFANTGNDRDATASLAKAFLQGFVHAIPTGKQTSTAAQTRPDVVYIAVHDNAPISLASAFEKAIQSRDGYREAALTRLSDEAAAVQTFLGVDPNLAGYAGSHPVESTHLGTNMVDVEGLEGLVTKAADQALQS